MTKPLFARQPAELDFAPPGAGFIATRDRVRQPPAAIDTLGEWRALPRRRPSRWRPILVIAGALAAAILAGALTGCTSPHGPEMLPGTMPLPDGSRLAAFDAISKPDKWGLAATQGIGVIQFDPAGRASVVQFGVAPGQSDAGIALQLAAGVAGSIGGGAISGGLTERGLNTVASAVSSMKVPTPQIDLSAPKSVATSVAAF